MDDDDIVMDAATGKVDAEDGVAVGGGGVAAAAASGAAKGTQPWVNKYRPKSVDEVSYQEEVVSALRSTLQSGQMPHLLFYGPPGTGKTSTILALCRDLFGPELMADRVKELNASDERGISVVRNQIKQFASVVPKKSANRKIPNFKVLILDEADALLPDAQAALRRIMEVHTSVTRFCLICNYVSSIIAPLASRCAKFRFKPLDQPSMTARLRYIADQESVRVSDDTIAKLLETSGGDLRMAITVMQSAAAVAGDNMTPQDVAEASGSVPPSATAGLWEAVRAGKFPMVRQHVDDLVAEGFIMSNILELLHDQVLTADFTDVQKGRMCEQLAKSSKCLIDGADEQLQLWEVACVFVRVLKNRPVEVA